MTASPALALPSAALPPPPMLRRIALLDIALPVVAVVAPLHNGVAPLAAYAAASLFPASSVAVTWLRRGRFDQIGLGVLAGIAGALLIALFTGDARFGLVRAVPAFALFGVACLVSLPMRRPLMFFVTRAFATGGDAERVEAWNARLAVPGFRKNMRRLTAVWGAGTLAHAALSLAAVFLLTPAVVLVAEPVMGLGVLAALLAWTRGLQRRAADPVP